MVIYATMCEITTLLMHIYISIFVHILSNDTAIYCSPYHSITLPINV